MQYGIAMRSASQFGSMLITTRSMNRQMYKTDSDITDGRDKSEKHGDYSPLNSRTTLVQ